MQCPICSIDLLMADRQGVEIDYCSKCRGIWLDRGELEKLIELAMVQSAASYPSGSQHRSQDEVPYYEVDEDDNHSRHRNQAPQRKKESWLSRLMDFD